MGLQVWLPLNKKEFQDQAKINLAVFENNKSLYYTKSGEDYIQCNNSTIFNNTETYYQEVFKPHGLYHINYLINDGATFSPTGKLGGSYIFNGNSKIYTELLTNLNTTNLSLSFWFKATVVTGTQYLVSLNAGGGYADNVIGAAIESGKLVFIGGGSSIIQTAINPGVWYHCAVTVEGTSVKGYLNGSLVGTSNCNRLTNKNAFTVGARANSSLGAESAATYYYNGSICDVRLYDEILYKKEIKDLSLGLLVHYNFKDEKINGVTNLGGVAINYSDKNLGVPYNAVTETDSTQIGTVTYYDSGGYNNYPYKVYHKTVSNFDGEGIYSESAQDIYLEANKVYTVSCYIRSNIVFSELDYCFLSLYNPEFNIALGSGIVPLITTDWQRISFSFFIPEEYAGYYKEYSIITYNNDEPFDIYYSGFQVEQNSIANPFTLTNYNYSCLDSSGYGYDGQVIGSINFDKSNEITIFNNTNNSYIKLPNINTNDFNNSYSFIWQEYSVNNSGKMPWGFGNGNRLNCYHCNPICWNTGDGANNPFKNSNNETINPNTLNNGWHQLAITGDGTNTKLYIDGEYFGNATTYKSLTGSQIFISGWGESNQYRWNGYLKDFRIYTTTLSENDIKNLYNISMKIEKNGVLYSKDFIEYGDFEEEEEAIIQHTYTSNNIQINNIGELWGSHFSELNTKIQFFKDNDIGIDENKLNEI